MRGRNGYLEQVKLRTPRVEKKDPDKDRDLGFIIAERKGMWAYIILLTLNN